MDGPYQQENKAYWDNRAAGYSQVNQLELNTDQRQIWQNELVCQIKRHFQKKPPEETHILEVGTGPGFFAIILAEAGYSVTAVDYTPAMLLQAKANAGILAEKITFLEMDAEALTFPDGRFDVVLSRNLTWNLPHPKQAYREWARVLAPNGLLLNFDANWYAYLFDPAERAAYEQDRRNTAEAQIKDEYLCTEIDVMEEIAQKAPLSRMKRPDWDIRLLTELGMGQIQSDSQVWQRVWSREEKINFYATPMFLVSAVKDISL